MAQGTESAASDQGRRISWSEALVLAAVPLAAYGATFVYQTGYFRVFGLPLELINIDIRNVFVVVARLFPILIFLYMVTDLFVTIASAKWPPPITWRLRQVRFLYIVGFGLLLIYRGDWHGWAFWMGASVLLTLFLFLGPGIARSGKSYIERLEDVDQKRLKRLKTDPSSLTDKLISTVGSSNFLVLFYYGFALFLAFHAGRSEAMNRQEFYVASTSPESVVLHLTGDTAVCALFDRKTGDLEPSFSILKLEDHPDVMFRSEEIGPLHLPSPTPSPTPTVVPSPTPTITPSPTPTMIPTAAPGAP